LTRFVSTAPCAGEEQGLYLAGLLLSFLGYILAAAEERDEQDGARVFVVLVRTARVAPTLAACHGDGEQLQLRGATGRARTEVDRRRSWRQGTEAPDAAQGSGGRREAVGGGGIWTVVGPRGASRFRRIWGIECPRENPVSDAVPRCGAYFGKNLRHPDGGGFPEHRCG
jgi:hypothetical protein